MKHKTLTIRTKTFSYLLERRAIVWIAALFLATIAAACVSAGIGSLWIHPLEVLRSVFGAGEEMSETILSFRLPRVAMSILAGSCLAASGALLQSVTRNPLASPDIIGVTGGASAAGVAFLVITAGALSISWLSVAAIAGAAVTALLLYALSWKGGLSPLRLVLIGIAMQTAMSSISSLLIVTSPHYLATQAFTWLTGSVYGSSWDNVLTLLLWALVLFPLSWGLARKANIHELGEDVATGAGGRVTRERTALILVSAAFAGAAVSQVGAIGFIGLIAPHMARRLSGPSFGAVLPVSALIGAIVLLISDTIARTAFAPNDIPAGVFTAAVGAPFFIYMLVKHRNA
ncbi:FecCD family ABC transporter permease [Paenibacillus alkalitolerans]|uniref:FecCD family ABC transporter permease n=1 Tax=Paenibacillus alkalitolerans TaxID=2799335 RepID=UPI0018F52457|nr:iron ABC transporter permease [Paenibacillus alkalitolerans]